jgi:hypothetical protein
MDEAMIVSLRLSKEGFGSPEAILNMPTDIVLAALEYSGFIADYESTYTELNKPKK